jgi:hypothetical protein
MKFRSLLRLLVVADGGLAKGFGGIMARPTSFSE